MVRVIQKVLEVTLPLMSVNRIAYQWCDVLVFKAPCRPGVYLGLKSD